MNRPSSRRRVIRLPIHIGNGNCGNSILYPGQTLFFSKVVKDKCTVICLEDIDYHLLGDAVRVDEIIYLSHRILTVSLHLHMANCFSYGKDRNSF